MFRTGTITVNPAIKYRQWTTAHHIHFCHVLVNFLISTETTQRNELTQMSFVSLVKHIEKFLWYIAARNNFITIDSKLSGKRKTKIIKMNFRKGNFAQEIN
jgi:hypothetical protein